MPQLRPIKKSCKKLNDHGKKSETILHFILNSVSFFKGNKFHFHLDCDLVNCVLNVEFDSFSEKKRFSFKLHRQLRRSRHDRGCERVRRKRHCVHVAAHHRRVAASGHGQRVRVHPEVAGGRVHLLLDDHVLVLL